MSHYTEGRKFSRISNAWILESSWTDAEEIASLRARLAEATTPPASEVRGLVEQWRKRSTDALAESRVAVNEYEEALALAASSTYAECAAELNNALSALEKAE